MKTLALLALSCLALSIVACSSDETATETASVSDPSQKDVGPEHDFLGFWKTDCNDQAGLAIERAAEGMYSVSFCGPGGCFKPGTYRPNTTIVDDPAYVVVDENTLELEGKHTWSRYVRCDRHFVRSD